MTDVEQRRIEAICEVAHIKEIGDLSDGYHTFNQLYYQRMILFAALVKQNKEKAWKSLRHEEQYYSLFDCADLPCGKHWDGHTENDVTRLLSL